LPSMSDFLKGFSRDHYKKQRILEDRQTRQAAGDTAAGRPDRITREPGTEDTGIPENAREELYEKDPESGKRRIKRRIAIAAAILGTCLLIGAVIYFSRSVRLPDFTGGYAEQAQVWAVQNNIYIEIEEEYNLEYNRGIVISQTPAARQTIFKGGSMNMTVSKGPDPREHLELPDFSAMNLYEIEQWIAENRADNVSINRAHDDEVPVNRFIKLEFRDPEVTEETYKREDRMTITVSLGPEVFEKNIEVPDFKEEPKLKAVEWADSRGVELLVEESYSDTIPQSFIISQSITPGTKIAQNEKLTITVSKGRAIYAPSFASVPKDEAQIMAGAAGVTISIIERYHDSIGKDMLISQSVQPGTLLQEGQNTIVLYYSLGIPFIPDLSGQTEDDVVRMFAEMNNKSAGLAYKFEYVYDGKTPKGTVILNSPAGSRVPSGHTVTVFVSKGGKVIIKNYQGEKFDSEYMEKEIAKLESQGLKIVYNYVESNGESGTIVKQSIDPYQEISTAESILFLDIAN
jgi:beta-lactam-binding protein with PASTA domain